eukprot:15359741-Ditylum_brightwellii.AAC.1
MTQLIWHASHAVVMGSGFCFLRGIVELANRGAYASSVIKKRQYWPKYIWGDDAKEHVKDKDI